MRVSKLTLPAASVTHAPRVCIAINRDWIPILMSLAARLELKASWVEGTDVFRADQEALTLYRLLKNAEECFMFDVRLNNCTLEKTTDGGQTWTPIGDLAQCSTPGDDGRTPEFRTVVSDTGRVVQWKYTDEPASEWRFLTTIQDGEDGLTFTDVSVITLEPGASATGAVIDGVLRLGIPRGAQGLQGLQGAQGEQGIPGQPGAPGVCPDDCVNDPGAPPGDPSAGKRCAIAVGLTDTIREWFEYTLNQFDLTTSIAQTVLGAMGAFGGGVGVAALVGAVELIQQLGTGFIRNEATPAFWEGVRCALYGVLDNDGNFTSATRDAWKAVLPVTEVIHPIIRFQIDAMPLAEARRRAYVYGLGTSSVCELCEPEEPPEWCYTWDFTASNGGWFVRTDAPPGVLAGQYSDNAWRADNFTFEGQPGRGLDIGVDLPGSTTITYFKADWSFTPGNETIGFVRLVTPPEPYSPAGQLAADGSWSGELSGSRLVLDMQTSYGELSGSVQVTRVTIRGTGSNPFGASNCT